MTYKTIGRVPSSEGTVGVGAHLIFFDLSNGYVSVDEFGPPTGGYTVFQGYTKDETDGEEATDWILRVQRVFEVIPLRNTGSLEWHDEHHDRLRDKP
ncbi:hypothetical protein P8631_11535 (plasmid) [Guyparkeria sp. 1SP6A2]|nr:hypothetical protein [Guyparkeria sp. 1SP6A2]